MVVLLVHEGQKPSPQELQELQQASSPSSAARCSSRAAQTGGEVLRKIENELDLEEARRALDRA